MRWSQLGAFFRRVLGRERVERELDDELRSYLELLADEKAAQGLSPQDARRAAAVETGGLEQVKEEVRGARFGAWLEDAASDVRYGARVLARSPGFTIPAALALALGIGAATVIFGAVDAMLLKPLAYAERDRMMVVLHDGHDPVAPATFPRPTREAAVRSCGLTSGLAGRDLDEVASGVIEHGRRDPFPCRVAPG